MSCAGPRLPCAFLRLLEREMPMAVSCAAIGRENSQNRCEAVRLLTRVVHKVVYRPVEFEIPSNLSRTRH